jgi:RimJ/RimL family protein N-acetyltransferase
MGTHVRSVLPLPALAKKGSQLLAFAIFGKWRKPNYLALMKVSLIRCDRSGNPVQLIPDMAEELIANCQATADLYRRVGYVEPWVGYVAIVNGRGVGGGAFVGPPNEGWVEIAYFTLEKEQGQRYASQTAAALVAMARAHDPNIRLKAFTLKEENPSTRILRHLGFERAGTAHDADEGEVWEWRI